MNYTVSLANFNVTFGKDDEPLLNYFDSVVYNAFKSEIRREVINKQTAISDYYYFMDVDIHNTEEMGYVLYGKIVRETELEVKSIVSGDKLVKKNERYPSAPYSTFYIYLKNHRMLLIKNQKGSPSIKTFGTTAKYVLNKYIRRLNDDIRNKNNLCNGGNKQKFFPYSRVEVVGLPLEETLRESLKKVKKIRYLKLRFYPLNGDIDIEDIASGVARDFRKTVGSKTGSITLNSPESVDGVIELIDKSNGLVDASMKVEYENNSKGTISNDILADTIIWETNEDGINNVELVNNKAKGVSKLFIISEENKKLYDKFKDRIKSLLE